MTNEEHYITVVSGLPRSGTSLMMQMLTAGGIPPLTDNLRQADEDNPRGYFEFERVKQLKQDKAWLNDAAGKAVKIVHLLLKDLPPTQQYRVIFMRRNMNEILASQQKMLQRSGRSATAMNPELLAQNFQTQVTQILQWLAQQPNFRTLEVWHHDLIKAPLAQVSALTAFLARPLNAEAMVAAVDPNLHRNRS